MQGSRGILSTRLNSTRSLWGKEAAPEAKGSEQVQSKGEVLGAGRGAGGRGRGRRSADPGA